MIWFLGIRIFLPIPVSTEMRDRAHRVAEPLPARRRSRAAPVVWLTVANLQLRQKCDGVAEVAPSQHAEPS